MSVEQKVCPSCKSKVLASDLFCGNCGNPLNQENSDTEEIQVVEVQESADEENNTSKIEVIDTLCDDIHKIIDEKECEEAAGNLIHCSNCKQLIEKDSKFCKYCGCSTTVNRENKNTKSSSSDNTNLIACPECGKLVSKQAVSCPNCGHPFLNNQNTNTTQAVNNSSGIGFWGVVFAIIVAILIMSFC